jgi:hypothetical protein
MEVAEPKFPEPVEGVTEGAVSSLVILNVLLPTKLEEVVTQNSIGLSSFT